MEGESVPCINNVSARLVGFFSGDWETPRELRTGSPPLDMEDLTKHWSSLSLSENEGLGLSLRSEQAVNEVGIVARFLTRRPLNLEAIANTFSPLWRSKSGFKVRNIGNHVTLFSFENNSDVERILSSEPWSFDKHIMVISHFDKENPINASELNMVAFWVQVYDIPLRFRNKDVAEQICEIVGTIIHPSTDSDYEGGSFIRVRVMVDISKPLCRGRRISLEDGKTHWVSFKYERLPNLCYWCGCLTHNDRDCEKWIESEGSLKPDEQQFGSWLRAPPFFSSRKNVISVQGFFSKKKQSTATHPTEPQQPTPPAREQQPSPETPPHPPRTTSEISDKEKSEAVKAADFPPQKYFVSSEEVSPLKFSNHGDFEKVIQDLDSDIHCFDRAEASPMDPKDALPVEDQFNTPHQAQTSGPSAICSQAQPNEPTPLNDQTNLDTDITMSKTQSEGKWLRIQRPAHLKENQNPGVTLGKRISLDLLDSSIPPKRRGRIGAAQDENSLPEAVADIQPRRKR